jgi:DNA-binding PadR family transcriptional regulator
MLLQGPASGYALHRRIEASVGNFWHESFGQLYPALDELAASGLVTAKTGGDEPRDARAWSITAAGRRALAAWLERPPQPQRERNELLLKLFFAELAPQAVARHLEVARADAERDLARLAALRDEVATSAKDHPSLALWLATIDYGIAGQRALAAWCDQTSVALATAARHGDAGAAGRGVGRRERRRPPARTR